MSSAYVTESAAWKVIEEPPIRAMAFDFERCLKWVEPNRVGTEEVTHSPWMSGTITALCHEVIVANVDVAYRLLAPNMPLKPQVILVPLRVETELGVTTIANSITITPGTMTLDHDPDENALYVHMIDGRDPAEVVEPIRQWEEYALVIFDEERTPSDPAPEITVHPPDRPPEPKTVTQSLAEFGIPKEEENGGEDDG
jgi:multicomponent Na+:H+ antiporter subunit E